MRQSLQILIITNYYPPSRSWGYTQLCHEVVERLRERGHRLTVLTSANTNHANDNDEDQVLRRLHLESDPEYYRPLSFFTTRRRELRQNLRTLQEVVYRIRPAIIFVWGLWNTSKHLPALAERMSGPSVVYYLSDHWPALPSPHARYWNLPARRRYMAPIKTLIGWVAKAVAALEGPPPSLQFEHVMCVSRALRDSLVDQGVPVSDARIVYNGIEIDKFTGRARGREKALKPASELKMLVAGRLTHEKGVHTALEAVAQVVEGGVTNLHLTILGEGREDYVSSLHDLVDRMSLEQFVTFRGRVPRDQMPALLRQFDILIFPSIVKEALPRMPQEAMAAGLAVIGTTTGGTQELLIRGETGLTFPPGDASALAQRINEILESPERSRRIARQGQQYVSERFNLERMVDEIETYLYETVEHDEGSAG